MRPVKMPPNRLAHFYLGGQRITDLRGVPAPAERAPEEWVASTTTRFGEETTGASALPDGSLLRDAVAADPDGWLGQEHLSGFGRSTGVLVKLLDAGERLPVHLHPDRRFAATHLDCPYGKTEAWYVIDAEPGAVCHLGFADDVDLGDLSARVQAQDRAGLLDSMHTIEVSAGDGILVPAGMPHAIGAGIMVVEAQEPTDFSIMLEWEGFPLDPEDWHLGLGPDTALGAVDRAGWSAEAITGLVHRHPKGQRADALLPVLSSEASAFFRVDLARPADHVAIEPGFAVLVVLAGQGSVVDDAGSLPVRRGDVLAIGHGVGGWGLTGEVTGIVCRPALQGPLAGGPT